MQYKYRKPLGLKLKKMREDASLQQDFIAECAGISAKSLSQIENGHVSTDIETLELLACAYGISVPNLVDVGRVSSPRIIRHTTEECVQVALKYMATGGKLPEARTADPLLDKAIAAWGRLNSDTERNYIIDSIQNLAAGRISAEPIPNLAEPDKKPRKS